VLNDLIALTRDLGPHALLVPYAHPGPAIAREVHAGLRRAELAR
jgi:hypothetical protein